MVQGLVVGPEGRPAASPILVYAPGVGEVGVARSGADGRFEVRAGPTGDFATAVRSNGGAVTLRVEVASDSARDPQALPRVWKGGAWEGADEPVTLQDPTPTARARAAAVAAPLSQLARCVPRLPGDDTYPKRWTVIGRMNPNRGTTAAFTYGREHVNEISFSVNAAFKELAIGGGQLSGERRAVSETDTERGKGRFRVLAYVRYHRELLRWDRGPKVDQLCTKKAVVTPDRVYETNLRTDRKARDRPGVAGGDCRNSRVFDHGHRVDHDPGDTVSRREGAIEATTLGVKVAGIGLDTQSGYSSNVQVAYAFSSRRLRYYICGTGGHADAGGEPMPSTWKQLWAGA